MKNQNGSTAKHPFALRPASREEAGLFYSDEEQDDVLGTVGHVRMDFGSGGKQFWSTWWPHNGDQLNTPEFKEELQMIVDALRQDGPLQSLSAMNSYCWHHGGEISKIDRIYGYIAETAHYRFCLRCTPRPGEYQGYLYCYDLRQQRMQQQDHLVGRVTYASGEQQEFTDPQEYLRTIREELPYSCTAASHGDRINGGLGCARRRSQELRDPAERTAGRDDPWVKKYSKWRSATGLPRDTRQPPC